MSFIKEKLRPHQQQAMLHLLSVLHSNGAALDGSDMGTGKTYTATAVAATLDLPTLVVCPKIAISAWADCADYLGTSFSVNNYESIRTGRTPFGTWDNNPPPGFERETFFKCQSCQCVVDLDAFVPCYCHHAGIHCLETKKHKWKYGKFHWHPGIEFLIADEVHRCGALAGLNYEMLVAAKRQRIKILGLSATPATSPLGMKALGFALGLHGLLNYPAFLRRHGCRLDAGRGWKFYQGPERQREIMAQLNADLFPARGVRVRKSEIPGFPECSVSAQLFDLNAENKIDQLYEQMATPLGLLGERRRTDSTPDAPVTATLRAREEIELLLVPVLVELAKDDMEKGFSVALFINFTSALRELRNRLPGCVYIDGSQTVEMRRVQIGKFQANEARAIIVNNQAGGISVSLHDLHGGFPRVGYVIPSFSAVDMRQVFGRLPREGGKSRVDYRVIIPASKVGRHIHRRLSAKLDNLDALTDADLMPENLRMPLPFVDSLPAFSDIVLPRLKRARTFCAMPEVFPGGDD